MVVAVARPSQILPSKPLDLSEFVKQDLPVNSDYEISEVDFHDCLADDLTDANDITAAGKYIISPSAVTNYTDLIELVIKKELGGETTLYIPMLRNDHWLLAEVVMDDNETKKIILHDSLTAPAKNDVNATKGSAEYSALINQFGQDKIEIKYHAEQTADSSSCGFHVMRRALKGIGNHDHPLAKLTSNKAEDLIHAATAYLAEKKRETKRNELSEHAHSSNKQLQEDFDRGFAEKIELLEKAYKAQGIDVTQNEDAILKQAFDNQLYNPLINNPEELMNRYRQSSSRFFVVPDDSAGISNDFQHQNSNGMTRGFSSSSES